MSGPRPDRTYRFEVSGTWRQPERRGRIALGGGNTAAYGVPQAMGGPHGDVTSPEELLLASALACFDLTLGGLLARRGLDPNRVSTAVRGEVSRTREGLHFDGIEVRPTLLGSDLTEEDRERYVTAMQDAEAACFIARTLRPTVPYRLEVQFA